MAQSEQDVSQGMLTAGFQKIDSALAANDARSAQMLDEYLIGLSRAYGKRIGINANALRSMASKMIQQRAAQIAQAEQSASDAKASATMSLGGSQRKFDLGMEGLRINQEQFDRNMFRRYVGAAVQAAGAVIAEGVRNGLFDFDKGTSKKADKPFEAPKLKDPGTSSELQDLKTLSTELAGGKAFTLEEPSAGLTGMESTPLQELQLQSDPGLLRRMQMSPENQMGTRGRLDYDFPSFGIEENFAPSYDKKKVF